MSQRAPPAGGGAARDVLPSQPGAGVGDRRRGPWHAAAAAAAWAAGTVADVKLEITHSTRYRYSGPIAETVMEVRLRPMDGNGQSCVDFHLEISAGIKPRSYRDGYGNDVHYFNLVRPHTSLSVTSRSVVETGGELDPARGETLVQDFLRFRS